LSLSFLAIEDVVYHPFIYYFFIFKVFIRVIYMSVPKGVTLANVQPMNGSTPQNAAFNNMKANNHTLASLTNAVSGGGTRRRTRRRTRQKYKGGSWVAPQIRPIYQEVGGAGQTTIGVSNKLASVQAQNHANGVFDSTTIQQGGRRRRKTWRLGRVQRQRKPSRHRPSRRRSSRHK
jgi:hypothetical protein